MNIARIRNSLALALALSTLLLATACGGGDDDEAGSLTPLSVVPSDITVTGPAGFCPGAGTIGKVFIYGGTAPYRIDNTNPDFVTTDKSSVGDRGGSFTVTSLGQGCLDTGPIVVRDKNERQVIVTISLEEGS
jgi:hypothetical protein